MSGNFIDLVLALVALLILIENLEHQLRSHQTALDGDVDATELLHRLGNERNRRQIADQLARAVFGENGRIEQQEDHECHSQRDKKLRERRKYRTDFPDLELGSERQIQCFVVTLQLVFLGTEASNNAVITEQLLGHLQHLTRSAFALTRHLAHLPAINRNPKAQYRHHYQKYQRQLPVQIKNVGQQYLRADQFTEGNILREGHRILQAVVTGG